MFQKTLLYKNCTTAPVFIISKGNRNTLAQSVINCILICIVVCSTGSTAPPEPKEFFDTLEYNLREDYRICTGDSATPSINQLLAWKKQIDEFLESDLFKTIVKSFYAETGLDAFKVRPCEIILWKENHEKIISDANKLFSADLATRQKRIQDSILILKILKDAKISSLDFAGIPFGISKKIFILFAQNNLKLPFDDMGSTIQYKQISIDGVLVKVAFHFDKDGYYRMYELESEGGPLDSLDNKVRLESAELAALLEVKSGSPPDHIYRIGRFDIIQGRLAVERSWNLESVSAYAGLATFRYHYYGKAVVVAREIIILPDSTYQNR